MLRKMKPGSVFVDISIDQGGCAETSRPTTHLDPVYVEEGVTHYCVANMPAAYARTATQALTNVTYRYVELLADLGLEGACKKQPTLIGGINTRDGRLTCKAVAEAHGLKWEATVLVLVASHLCFKQHSARSKTALAAIDLLKQYASPNYEEIHLHSGRCRASRGVRAKN